MQCGAAQEGASRGGGGGAFNSGDGGGGGLVDTALWLPPPYPPPKRAQLTRLQISYRDLPPEVTRTRNSAKKKIETGFVKWNQRAEGVQKGLVCLVFGGKNSPISHAQKKFSEPSAPEFLVTV